MKKMLISISIFVFLTGFSYSQTDKYFTPSSDTSSFNLKPNQEKENKSFFDDYSLSPGVRIGSSFSSFGGNPMFSSYFAPEMRLNTPGKLSMNVGTSVSYSSFPQFSGPEAQHNSYFEKMATYNVYATGSYRYNENLNIRAGGSVVFFPGKESEPLKRGHIGFDYKLGDNAWISADFDFGDSMWHNGFNRQFNPYSRGFNRSPFHFQNSHSPAFY